MFPIYLFFRQISFWAMIRAECRKETGARRQFHKSMWCGAGSAEKSAASDYSKRFTARTCKLLQLDLKDKLEILSNPCTVWCGILRSHELRSVETGEISKISSVLYFFMIFCLKPVDTHYNPTTHTCNVMGNVSWVIRIGFRTRLRFRRPQLYLRSG